MAFVPPNCHKRAYEENVECEVQVLPTRKLTRKSRDPLCYEENCLIAKSLMTSGEPHAARSAAYQLLDFDTYRQPGAMAKLAGCDLLPPVASNSEDHTDTWHLAFFSPDRSKKLKTGILYDIVPIGFNNRKWLHCVVEALKDMTKDEEALFQISDKSFRRRFKKALKNNDLNSKKVPHQNRYGGASLDGHVYNRLDICRRGGWTSPRNCLRHIQCGRYNRVVNTLTSQQRKAAKDAEEFLRRNLPGAIREEGRLYPCWLQEWVI